MSSSNSYFNYCVAVKRLCHDIVHRLPEFAAIRIEDVGFSLIRTRNREKYGIFASMTPLRSEEGTFLVRRRGHLYEMPDIRDQSGHQLLYVFSIYVPRFLDLTLSEKLNTIIHELYHISPLFNGDLRRFQGRCFAHGSSKKDYDQRVANLSKTWLSSDPSPELWDFLRYDFKSFCERFGGITGTKINLPPFRLIK